MSDNEIDPLSGVPIPANLSRPYQYKSLLLVLHDAPFFLSHRLAIGLAARDLGFEVHIAAPHDSDAVRKIRGHGFIFHPIPLVRGGTNLKEEWRLLQAVFRLIKRLHPNIVHAVSAKPILHAGIAARVLKVPALVLAVTGLGYLFLKNNLKTLILRRMILWGHRVGMNHPNVRAIFQNPDDLAEYQKAIGGALPEVVMIKGCGVDLEQFSPRAWPDQTVVMFSARLIADKGVHEFMQAVNILKPKYPKVRFVLVGADDPNNPTNLNPEQLKSWIAEGLVEHWGQSKNMPNSLNQASIIVLPSYREGLPRGLIEAAAVARPIVTTDVPGCREIVQDGVNGLLVPAQDGPATAAAIQRLLDDLDWAKKLGLAGRARAEAEFSVGHFVKQSMAVYQDLLKV